VFGNDGGVIFFGQVVPDVGTQFDKFILKHGMLYCLGLKRYLNYNFFDQGVIGIAVFQQILKQDIVARIGNNHT
jgi:hypothetical protein